MTFRAVTLLDICVLLAGVYASPMHAQEARSDDAVWAGSSWKAIECRRHL